jgi:hypothetical protein
MYSILTDCSTTNVGWMSQGIILGYMTYLPINHILHYTLTLYYFKSYNEIDAYKQIFGTAHCCEVTM